MALLGFHHVALTVSSVDISIAWYREVLGFELAKRWEKDGMDKAMMLAGDAGLRIVLVGHGVRAVAGGFSERRNGLDHLGFAVADRAVLLQWQDRLERAGVAHSGLKQGSSGELIAFRDPDNIALEFYTLS